MNEIPEELLPLVRAAQLSAGFDTEKAIAKAILTEREEWQSAVEAAIDPAVEAERVRCADLVDNWRAGLRGSEYLNRSIGLLVAQIRTGA
ncbi:hypothetical protein EOS93_25320 [Rhizobium sp. RMa-01]|uniref:hypothetical protein n=1 Tax=unclassified Rhizobium TaxID=2613769 RepID=UPI0008DA894E|nr:MULTISPECIES: hypothetical protein [unclassified Rhizobium]OHV24920.1 hypothetical protein BBJ66_22515 [Rhizobium sp. RSm-3]RVU08372.1 hypothetical protein EOS93_25320 [Rhizobium sp. RMa-01]